MMMIGVVCSLSLFLELIIKDFCKQTVVIVVMVMLTTIFQPSVFGRFLKKLVNIHA